MPGQHKCPCGADLPTLRGLRSHQSQSQECRAWAIKVKVASSSDSSEGEALEGPSHLEPITPPVESMQLSDDKNETDNTVNSLITHTLGCPPRGMGYEGVWALRAGPKMTFEKLQKNQDNSEKK